MVSNRALAGLIASTLFLVACTDEIVVDVTKRGDTVTFTTTRPGADEKPCVQGLVVTLAGADLEVSPPLWELATAEPGRCRMQFDYGQVPAGYSQNSTAPRLLVGSRYLVEIKGPGLQGGREFTVVAGDGNLTNTTPR
jgi:hypothetical protein